MPFSPDDFSVGRIRSNEMQGFLTMPYQHDELRFNDYLYLFADRSTSFHFRFAGEQRKGG